MKIVLRLPPHNCGFWIVRWNFKNKPCLCWNGKKVHVTVLEEAKSTQILVQNKHLNRAVSFHLVWYFILICMMATWIIDSFRLFSSLFKPFCWSITCRKVHKSQVYSSIDKHKNILFNKSLWMLSSRPRNTIFLCCL